MASLKELIEMGKDLGLTGDALSGFIDKEREEMKRREDIEREEMKRREEREEKKRQEDIEREEKKRREDIEREERRETREMEKLRLEKEIELEKIKSQQLDSESKHNEPTGTNTTKFIKIPKFDDKSDTMDAYIHRFEFLATSKNLDKKHWSVCLSQSLSGASLEVLQSMTIADAGDYDKLKTKLLERFKYNQEGYRKQFKACKPNENENFDTFFDKLGQTLNKWIEASDIKNGDYNKLRCLMLFEQLYDSCNPKMVSFLKEHNPKNETEMREYALLFEKANPGTKLGKHDVGNFAFKTDHRSRSTGRFMPRDRRNWYQRNENFQDKHRNRESQQAFENSRNQFRRDNSRHWQPRYSHDRGRSQYRQDNNTKGREENGNQHKDQTNNAHTTGDNGTNTDYKQHEHELKTDRGGYKREQSKDRYKPRYPKNRYYQGNLCFSPPKYRENNHESDQHMLKVHNTDIVKSDENEKDMSESKMGDEYNLSAYTKDNANISGLILFDGEVNGKNVKVLKDTGANTNAVRRDLVLQEQFMASNIQCKQFNGDYAKLEIANIHVKTPFYTGWIEACVVENPVVPLIMGMTTGTNKPLWEALQSREGPSSCLDDSQSAGAATRAQVKKEKEIEKKNTTDQQSEKTKEARQLIEVFDAEEFRIAQQNDKSLAALFDKAEKEPDGLYKIKDKLLYKVFTKDDIQHEVLVVPTTFRKKLIKVAHDSIASGHMGSKSTKKRLQDKFTWPRMYTDITDYVKSCHICQIKSNAEPPIPLEKMEVIGTPWKKCAFDIAGPLPLTDKKNRYILTVVDYATRWPECVPLKSITTEEVTKGLVSIFSRMGIPEELLSDNAPAFLSGAMKEAMELLGIQRKTITPYHSQSNGLCERFIGTVKKMIGKLTHDHPKRWDQMLDTALFAYREIPQSSTEFSPFTLMFGRKVRGPIDVIYDICTGNTKDEIFSFTYNYVNELKDTIIEANKLAQENREHKAEIYKKYADRSSKYKKFKKGDKVLLLMPMKNNSMKMSFQGPYVIEEVGVNNNYTIKIGRKLRTYHANILKLYHDRQETNLFEPIGNISVVFEDEDSEQTFEPRLELPALERTKSWRDVKISDDLTEAQQEDVKNLLAQFDDVLTDIPGKTNVLEHKIRLVEDKPIRTKQYPIPFHARDAVMEEVQHMISNEIIRESNSEYCSPITVIKKKDGKLRICLDYRKINSNCCFDAEPIPNQEELVSRIQDSKYFSRIDLTKGYWQIPLDEESKKYTAFQTPLGLMEFNYLPFGLAAASSTFQRMMRIVFKKIQGALTYFDDILVHTITWEQHLHALYCVLMAKRRAGLTANPPKCLIGFLELDFLGHMVGKGYQKPEYSKILKIQNLATPTTKKQVKSICGLMNYYRKFIPEYAKLAKPLTDLTKKGQPNKVHWNEECEKSFQALKDAMSSSPILALPDMTKPFILRSDASDYAIGATLLQEHDGILKPVLYASRKLNEREAKYPIIEKEALAVIFAVGHFSKYLLLRPFLMQTDHKPLTFLKKNKTSNNRLMRWALVLQRYSYTVEAIPGTENVISDILSRL